MEINTVIVRGSGSVVLTQTGLTSSKPIETYILSQGTLSVFIGKPRHLIDFVLDGKTYYKFVKLRSGKNAGTVIAVPYSFKPDDPACDVQTDDERRADSEGIDFDKNGWKLEIERIEISEKIELKLGNDMSGESITLRATNDAAAHIGNQTSGKKHVLKKLNLILKDATNVWCNMRADELNIDATSTARAVLAANFKKASINATGFATISGSFVEESDITSSEHACVTLVGNPQEAKRRKYGGSCISVQQ